MSLVTLGVGLYIANTIFLAINIRFDIRLRRAKSSLEERDLLQRALWIRRLDKAEEMTKQARTLRDRWKFANMAIGAADPTNQQKEIDE